ncbi:MAG: (d)CMP kinase, partial [Roseomonas sp.]|nr:(d)CMP kinase [Roseomonas sp.]
MNEIQPQASDLRRSHDRSSESAASKPKGLFVVGPTASGKSALALAIAERLGGAIINADSMQLYRELHIITARPSA